MILPKRRHRRGRSQISRLENRRESERKLSGSKLLDAKRVYFIGLELKIIRTSFTVLIIVSFNYFQL